MGLAGVSLSSCVGLIGCGTVGAGVARRLLSAQRPLLGAIAVRDVGKPRDVPWHDFVDDPFAVVDDPAIAVVVVCIGGVRLARELALRAIARGKDVVTANEALIAAEGAWLRAFAARTGASLRHVAAAGRGGDAVAAAIVTDVLAALDARGDVSELHSPASGNSIRARVVRAARPSPRPA